MNKRNSQILFTLIFLLFLPIPKLLCRIVPHGPTAPIEITMRAVVQKLILQISQMTSMLYR